MQPGELGGHDLVKFVELKHFNTARTKRSDLPGTRGGGCRRNSKAQGGERGKACSSLVQC
jgi:hypothetical protein